MPFHSQHAAFDVKRIIGKPYESIEIDPFWPFQVVKDNQNVKIKLLNFKKSPVLLKPQEISSVLLKHMKKEAEEYKGEKLSEVVVTIPVAFNQSQIGATMEAAALAGWKSIHTLPEPIAACFAYASEDEIPKNSNVLIFDLGGGTVDICIVRIENDQLRILGSVGDLYLGGRNFDSLLMNHFMPILTQKYKVDFQKNSLYKYRLLLRCQEIKHDLEAVNEVNLYVDEYIFDSNAIVTITSAEFKRLSHQLLVKLNVRIKEALDNLKFLPQQINYVLQVGGGCRMGMVKDLLKNMFPNAQHRCVQDPDWAVAYGASLYCCHLQSQSMDKKDIPNDIEKMAECVGWDCGAGAIRIANIDTRYRPEPQLITDLKDNPNFLAMTCMRVPQAFHEETLSNTPAHIIMDAFRCKPTDFKYLFCVKRENDGYLIPSHRRLMKNNPTEEDLKENGIQIPHQFYSHEDIMTSIIQEISKAFNVRNVLQKEAYLCVPDAAGLDHIRKLRNAFIRVFENRKVAKANPKPKDTIKPSDSPEALEREEVLTASKIFFIQRTAAAIQIYGIRNLFNRSDDALGGEDLCYRLCEHAANHPDMDDDAKKALEIPRLKKFLRNTMDQAKIDLSKKTPAIVDVEVNDDRVITLEISREEFETKIAHEEFSKIKKYIEELKEHTEGLIVTDILLVRGSTRTKKVIDLVEENFPTVPIVKCLNTDECIVMGTALKGALRNGIHRTAYAEVEDIAMHDQWVEIDGIKLFLTKKYESVQNSKEHWIEPLGGNKLTYMGHFIDTSIIKRFRWKRDVSCDPCVMTNNRINMNTW
uniref:Uncharacterized protein n=1 Tax=Panagrolaimus sp. ES5 TaxID=591445 RepID=A0AC34F8P5_9BILA